MNKKNFGHRGAVDLCPENSMAGFKKTIELGADGIELDIHLTKDDELVVFHDFEMDRLTNKTGEISDYTLAELEKISIGEKFSEEYKNEMIPSLEKVLDFMKNNDAELNIELKAGSIMYKDIEHKVVKMADDYGLLNRILFSSFDHNSMVKIQEIDNSLYTGVIYMGMFTPAIIEYVNEHNFNAIHPLFKHLYPELIKKCNDNNIDINTYTIYNMEEYNMVKDWDINIIMANNLSEILG